MLDLLLPQPVVTARVVMRELEVSARTAPTALQRLVDDGILLESIGHRRNRVYRRQRRSGPSTRMPPGWAVAHAEGRRGPGVDQEIRRVPLYGSPVRR